MRGLSSLERVILESIGNKNLSYEEIQTQSGLQENVCFNILQAMMIRGILRFEHNNYKVNNNISPEIMEEINGIEARKAESLELIEATLDQKEQRIFRFQKVAMDSRDEKIFMAMLSNLESFLKDAHQKSQLTIPIKNRKVVFWGMGDVQKLMNQAMLGR
jgi:hypothetical protein